MIISDMLFLTWRWTHMRCFNKINEHSKQSSKQIQNHNPQSESVKASKEIKT